MYRFGVQKLYGWCRHNVLNFIVEMPGSNVGLDTGCLFVVILSSAGNFQDSNSICRGQNFFKTLCILS
jgi:hypothetical protein